MEEDQKSNNTSRKCTRGYQYYHRYHYHYQTTYHRLGLGLGYQSAAPALLPLPPTLPLPPPVHHHLWRPPWPQNTTHPLPPPSQDLPAQPDVRSKASLPLDKKNGRTANLESPLTVARRPDSGGVEGRVINLVANHFLVRFDPSQRIYHYDVEISPNPSKDVARTIKRKLVEEHSSSLSGASPVYDGRRTLYSPIEFKDDRLELYISLPMPLNKVVGNCDEKVLHKDKIFRVIIKLVSKFDGENLNTYLRNRDECIPLPQEYVHALDIVLREGPSEKCMAAGRSFYSTSIGGAKELGGGAVALRGFFQSLRPTQQGLALNVDYSVTAFHDSIGVIPYLIKSFEFMRDATQFKARRLAGEERKDVERAMRNIRVFVRHRETVQRYRVYTLTEEVTEDLWFPDRDGKSLRLMNYFKDHYGYDVQYTNLPCLQVSRRKPCYLPMELCIICEGQKFLGKLSDDQTVKILKMGCQRPAERKAIISRVMDGAFGPISGTQVKEFDLQVTREMTRLTGRILRAPKLKLGHGGIVRNLTPSRHDRQWNLLDSHVFEGARVERWAIISFGGGSDQKAGIPKFIKQLCQRCEQLGIFLHRTTVVDPIFEPMHVLSNAKLLESKLGRIHKAKAALGDLQLLVCVMERKHKGYADLKRIAETRIGVVSQCCLYANLGKPSSQFLANMALKINAKVGGCTVALYNSLPSQVPRLFKLDEPVIFMGADVTHPHPFDDVSPSVAAVVGSVNWPAANKYVSRMRSQTHRQEIIQDLCTMVAEILDDFCDELSNLPRKIIFFRDGVSETQFQKVLHEELQAIRHACTRFPGGYKPEITFIVVQKRHHTRLFPCDTTDLDNHQFSDENVPPGTVVDTVITHPNEFDFYLCSHWGVKGTSRPIHYHVLWDESRFSSDEVQTMVHNLCYTFVRCTKPISLVPPAYYAHLAAYRGRLYLDRPDSSAITRTGPPKTVPLPKLSENLRKLMFYC